MIETPTAKKEGFVAFAFNDLNRNMKTALIDEWQKKFMYGSRGAIQKRIGRKTISIGETDLVIRFLQKHDLLEVVAQAFKESQTKPAN